MQENQNNKHEKLQHKGNHSDVISAIIFTILIFGGMFALSKFLN